jgi:hypothetical protein
MTLYIKELDAVFLHVPKAAGSFLTVFFKNYFSYENISNQHSIPLYLEKKYQNKKMFCFIRDPISWYKSYWSCIMTQLEQTQHPDWFHILEHNNWGTAELDTPWHPNRMIDVHCGSRDFNDFVFYCIKDFPSYVSQMYKLYTDHCYFIGKYENLYEDVVKLLEPYGYDKAEIMTKLKALPMVNESSPKWKAAASMKPKLEATLKTLETCEAYAYTRPKSEEILSVDEIVDYSNRLRDQQK